MEKKKSEQWLPWGEGGENHDPHLNRGLDIVEQPSGRAGI